jgi:TetR/AcrR family transcriptional regulator, tetracycline repressor protein
VNAASTPPRRGGRPPVLSRADIVAAAVVVIDEDGLDALTMRGLGARLGVAAMSLYRHLANRDAVLSAVVDHLVAQAAEEPVPGASWRSAVRGFADRYRAVLLDHPRAVPLLATHPVTIDTGLALMAGVLGAFDAAGVDRDRALTVVQSVVVFTLGHALAQVGPDGELPPADAGGYYDAWYNDAVEAMLDGFGRRVAD